VIVVHKNGKEQLFESKRVLTEYLGVSYVTVCHHADTGKRFSDKQVRVYTTGKRIHFHSVKDVARFYGISKNITRKQIEDMTKTGKTIRGHKVLLK
jgi:ABC-type antimicrobial peptide transport system ATPase subunit